MYKRQRQSGPGQQRAGLFVGQPRRQVFGRQAPHGAGPEQLLQDRAIGGVPVRSAADPAELREERLAVEVPQAFETVRGRGLDGEHAAQAADHHQAVQPQGFGQQLRFDPVVRQLHPRLGDLRVVVPRPERFRLPRLRDAVAPGAAELFTGLRVPDPYAPVPGTLTGHDAATDGRHLGSRIEEGQQRTGLEVREVPAARRAPVRPADLPREGHPGTLDAGGESRVAPDSAHQMQPGRPRPLRQGVDPAQPETGRVARGGVPVEGARGVAARRVEQRHLVEVRHQLAVVLHLVEPVGLHRMQGQGVGGVLRDRPRKVARQPVRQPVPGRVELLGAEAAADATGEMFVPEGDPFPVARFPLAPFPVAVDREQLRESPGEFQRGSGVREPRTQYVRQFTPHGHRGPGQFGQGEGL